MFIIDSDNRLIAAEPADLARWQVEDLYEAARAFQQGRLQLDRNGSRITLPSGESMECRIQAMESFLGSWSLCTLQPAAEAEELVDVAPATESPAAPEKESAPALEIDEEELLSILPLEDEEEPEAPAEESPAPVEEEPESLDEEIEALLQVSEEEEETITLMSPEEEARSEQEEEESPLSLLPDEEPPAVVEELEEAPDESTPIISIPEAKAAPWEEVEEEFQPDLHANAERIELSDHEYADLLREFIGDSHGMREQLLDDDEQKRRHAAAILKDAISLLHLSPLERLLDMLEDTTADERHEIVNEYDRLLGQLEVMMISLESAAPEMPEAPPAPPAEEPAPSIEATAPVVEETPPSIPEAPLPEPEVAPGEETPPAPEPEETPETEISITPERETPPAVSRISVEEFLKGVKPIPIEFSLQIASEELNLPEDLVLEFINDFDKQGHEYLPVLIDAYQKKDLDHLQKTAHMLKGAASNLRIEAMVDNLYDLQFDNDIERAPQRIRLFAGQLMSLDNYLEQMNQ
jgi:HPt (histidine-containing phosphotransfer) domain-containing protein